VRLRAGDFVDDMEIVGMLGEGATSEVYLVRDRAGIFRALKLLSVHGSAHRRRMRIEAGALRHLRHENVVGVLAMVEHEGWMGVLMEYVAGPTLHRWMDVDTAHWSEAVRLTRGILTGVDVLHQAGLVHRDLKPGNVLLDVSRDGVRPRLADFGLVKQLDAVDGNTHTGVSMGTLTYMAPEQLRDASRVDGRADLYSVGAILHELLTGRPPFDRTDMFEAWRAIEAGDRADLSGLPPDVPERVRRLLQGLLEPDPVERISSVSAAFTALDGRQPVRPLPPAPPLEPGSDGALRARLLSDQMYEDVRSTVSGGRADLRGLDPTTFNAEFMQELSDVTGEHTAEHERMWRRTRRAMMVVAAPLLLLAALGVLWRLTSDGTTSVEQPALAAADTPAPFAAAPAPDDRPEPVAHAEPPDADASSEVATATAPIRSSIPPTSETPSGPRAPARPSAGSGGTGVVRVTGDAHALRLVGKDGSTYVPGQSIPPGTYSVRAQWTPSDTFHGVGSVRVTTGDAASIHCVSAFLRCRQ
jgi:serine/threonine-protein kinase